ncbi:phosphoribosylglycinamide formyltransferase [bacterium]|jgi:phosphoribosylglycinamide formyltransferase-1|nr:phosphoribosylglycinamide formyltransferase [bacterium]MBT3794875.1 phosphoribosylglycinamide formyltransferase [bacterium]MBT4634931.1 phosphoribosylglycinamide formyltransferase [bacterium]
MSDKFKIAIFSSGNGSNFEAIVNAHIPNIEVSLLFCNMKDAYVLERARKLSIESLFLSHKDFDSRKAFETEIISRIEKYNIQLIVLAGFKRILSPFFTSHYEKKVINLHPSLLPAFTGLHAPRQAVDYGAKFSGCTVHYVDEGIDTGPIITQGLVEIDDNDTEETLIEKIHKKEHEILPKAIQLISEDKCILNGRRVLIKS